MRIDRSGADVQSLGELRSREFLGINFIQKRYGCSGTAPSKQLPGSRRFEADIPGIVDVISHGAVLARYCQAKSRLVDSNIRLLSRERSVVCLCGLQDSRHRPRRGGRRGGHRALDNRLQSPGSTAAPWAAFFALILLAELLQAVLAAKPCAGLADNAVARRVGRPSVTNAVITVLVRPAWIGICTICSIRSCSSTDDGSTNGSSTKAHRHSTGYGRTIDTATIDATAIDAGARNATAVNAAAGHATVITAGMTNTNASSICEGVS